MPNYGAVRFVKRLTAAFGKYPIPNETKELYVEKVSTWKLSDAEWDRALDVLIDSVRDERLPELKRVYLAINSVEAGRKQTHDDLGWMYVTRGRHCFAARVFNDGGVWKLVSTGNEPRIQKDASVEFIPDRIHIENPVPKPYGPEYDIIPF